MRMNSLVFLLIGLILIPISFTAVAVLILRNIHLEIRLTVT